MFKSNEQIINEQEELALSQILHLLSEINLSDLSDLSSYKIDLWTQISSIALSCAIKHKKNQNEQI